jgi:peptide/nickel transport system substrate-binding protein
VTLRRIAIWGTALTFALALAGGAGTATGSTGAAGGTINVDLATDVDFTDPALAYYVVSWEIEYATALKLLNYPDANGPTSSQLVPEAAAALPKVSKDGKVYDFTVNAGFTKLSNGQPVTAANFKAAFDRIADPKMQSPAISFMADIVGSDQTPVSGVRVRGNHLIIALTRPAPDFLARVAMPFFSAIPTNLPHNPEGEATPPSAGPYYVASRVPNKSIVLKRNPYYKGKRPHNATAISYTVGNSLEAIRLQVEQGTADYAADGLPPNAWAELAQRYGVNKSRVFVKPALIVSYLAFNHDRPIFKDNVPLKQAINYALDRRATLAQSGFAAGKRTDQILPPGLRGFRDADLYPLKGPNLVMAKKLAQGHTRDGKIVLYASNRLPGPLRAQIIQFNLKQIGLDVEVRLFARAVQFQKEGTRGEPFDLGDEGWQADYADPYDFINVLLEGSTLQDTNNNNKSYFNDPSYNRKMAQAALLSGPKRYSTYGLLDIDLMKNAAPMAPRAAGNDRVFVSARIGCFTYSNVYGVNIAALCLK